MSTYTLLLNEIGKISTPYNHVVLLIPVSMWLHQYPHSKTPSPPPSPPNKNPTPLTINRRIHIDPQDRKPLPDLVIRVRELPRHDGRVDEVDAHASGGEEEELDAAEAVDEVDGDDVHERADGAVHAGEEEDVLAGLPELLVERGLVVVCGGVVSEGGRRKEGYEGKGGRWKEEG